MPNCSVKALKSKRTVIQYHAYYLQNKWSWKKCSFLEFIDELRILEANFSLDCSRPSGQWVISLKRKTSVLRKPSIYIPVHIYRRIWRKYSTGPIFRGRGAERSAPPSQKIFGYSIAINHATWNQGLDQIVTRHKTIRNVKFFFWWRVVKKFKVTNGSVTLLPCYDQGTIHCINVLYKRKRIVPLYIDYPLYYRLWKSRTRFWSISFE